MSTTKKRNWGSIIEKISETGKPRKIKMGSPGSAQVTRCRLMSVWDGIEATTKGPYLFINLL